MKTRFSLCLVLFLSLTACGGLPKGIDPVSGFDVQRYLGTWYEIARLDHRFERGLSNVSAEYSLKDNGEIRVINRGYNVEDEKFTEAQGRARFAGDSNQGYLKVSFFGPFFGSYVVFDLDDDYSRAYVAGDDRSYLWFLSRTPTVSKTDLDAFVANARDLGFPVEQLIFVDQTLAK
ncbi:MAG: lipocalin family protein [Granulosicoccus sp.]